MLLVVVEDFLDTDNTGILVAFVRLPGSLLVPVKNTADERRYQGDTSFSTSYSLTKSEQQSEVAVNFLIALELARSLNTLPRRCDLNQNTFLVDAEGLVQSNEFTGFRFSGLLIE